MTLQLAGQIALGVLVGFIVVVILALVRNPIAISAINNGFFTLVAVPFIILAAGLAYLIKGITRLTKWLQTTLSSGSRGVSFWDFIGPLLYFVFFLVLLAGDAYLAAITFPELVGGAQPNLNPDILTPATAVLWVTIFLTIAGVTADLFGVTKFLRPYGEVTDEPRRWLQIAAVASMGLLVVAAVLFGVFRAVLATRETIGLVNGPLNVVFFVLLTIATAAASVAVPYGILALLALLAGIINIAAHILTFVASIPVNILDKAAEFAVGIYDVPAKIGQAIWNWLSQITRRKNWALGRVPDFVNRPPLGSQINIPTP